MAYNTKHTAEQIDALLGEVFESTALSQNVPYVEITKEEFYNIS